MIKRPLKAGDVYPAHVLRDEYGMNAANRPTIVVREEEVPAALRHLIPYAERWAISCDVTRGDYFDHQPETDVAAFWHEVLPHVDAVNQWLDALGDDVGTWPEAGVHFRYLLKAHGEAYQPTEEEQQAFEARRLAWSTTGVGRKPSSRRSKPSASGTTRRWRACWRRSRPSSRPSRPPSSPSPARSSPVAADPPRPSRTSPTEAQGETASRPGARSRLGRCSTPRPPYRKSYSLNFGSLSSLWAERKAQADSLNFCALP